MTESVSMESDSTVRNRLSPNWWGKAAMEVALNREVSDKAFRVFTVIAAYAKGNVAKVGQRRVATLMGRSQSYISKRVGELRASGCLATKAEANGQRAIYVLLSSAYKPNTRASFKPANGSCATEPPAPLEQVQSQQRCPRCHRLVKRCGRSGWCRSCIEQFNLESRVQAARAELGQDATPEQIAAQIKNARLALKIRRILERAERAA